MSVAFRGTAVVVFSREPSALFVVERSREVTKIVLPGASVASTAHDLFHRATANELACASCHPEGRDDGRVWNLPEGARRTNSLLGGLRASAPFHWTGDRADMQSVMDDVMTGRMAGRPQSAARNDALLDWLDQLPALPLPDDLDSNAVARGKALFEAPEQQCVTCHAGPLGTDNKTVDVGTSLAVQTPRLTGLASRAPYFHDGRIARLQDRFLPEGGGETHGHTASLTAAQRADLVEYLRSR